MILNVLFDIFFLIVGFVVRMIPEINLGFNFSSYLAPLANVVGYLDTFVSLSVVLSSIGVILIVDNWSFLVKLVMKLWSLLPFT